MPTLLRFQIILTVAIFASSGNGAITQCGLEVPYSLALATVLDHELKFACNISNPFVALPTLPLANLLKRIAHRFICGITSLGITVRALLSYCGSVTALQENIFLKMCLIAVLVPSIEAYETTSTVAAERKSET